VVEALFDDNPDIHQLYDIPVVGAYQPNFLPESQMLISIGNNLIRKRVANIVQHRFASVVHPSAIVAPDVVVGEGSVLLHGAVVQASATLGSHVIVNTAASVDHDCIVGSFAHISPHATLCGAVEVGEGVHVGAGAVLIQGIRIGKWATIGAGAVVIRDVPDCAVVVGNPGKIIRYQIHE
jgi:sugar O-acyltransferase (sialic acid O-acetyltransferase NeuD family)